MAECSLEITGCQSDYRPRETISGEVVVRVTEPLECRRLTIATIYRTQGGGAFESEPRLFELFVGQWQAGEYRYPFDLAVPPGPASYRGPSLQVTHWLVARCDLAQAKDPAAAEQRFYVAAEDVAGYDDGPGWPGLVVEGQGLPAEDATRQRLAKGCIVPSGLGFIFSLGLMIMIFGLVERGLLGLLVHFFFALPFLLFSMYLAHWVYWPLLTARRLDRLGRLDLRLDRATVRAGESTTFRLRYTARRRLALSGAVVEVESVETTAAPERVDREVVHHEKFSIELPERMAADETISRVLTIPIPRDAAPTFAAPGAMLTWKVSTHLVAGRRRLMSGVLPLTVRPPAALAATGGSA